MVCLPTIAAIILTVSPTFATNKVSYLDNFDAPRLTALPLGAAVDGTAGGALYYNAFGYNNLKGNPLLTPDSEPQVVGGGITLGIEEGQRFWKPINSGVVFDEKSIAYACIAYAVAGPTAKTISCTIQLAGKKYGTGNTVVQDLVYDPGLLGNKLNKTTFGADFVGLTEVDVTLASSPVGDPETVIIIDSHAYYAYPSS